MWILKDHLNWQLLGLIAKEASKGDRVGEVLQEAYDQAKTRRKSATRLDLLIITLINNYATGSTLGDAGGDFVMDARCL